MRATRHSSFRVGHPGELRVDRLKLGFDEGEVAARLVGLAQRERVLIRHWLPKPRLSRWPMIAFGCQESCARWVIWRPDQITSPRLTYCFI
jgi:hypothetical protein